MKDKKTLIYRTIDLISVIILYYIVGSKSIFLYVLSISLYNIFLSCFENMSIKETLNNIHTTKSKQKIFKYLLLIISVISVIFLLFSILVSDLVGLYLNINDTLPIFIIMGISVVTRPVIKVLSEYLENTTNNKNYGLLLSLYDIVDKVLFVVIALFSFVILKIDSIAILYLSKIFSFMFIIYLLYFTRNIRKSYDYVPLEDKLSYKREIKQILKYNNTKSIVNVVKESFYYISIIILYLVLSTRYNYKLNDIEDIITFIYFYSLSIVNYLVYLVRMLIARLPKDKSVIDRVYYGLKIILTIMIVLCIISPLTCKLIFMDATRNIYLVMANLMGIFILLYDVTFEYIKKKKVIFISLIIGILMKVILILPLINAFYRTGYNLLYGDILSTIIAMFISVIINYIHLRSNNNTNEKYFEKVLNILYDIIILAIILIIIQFVIPMDTSDYLRTLGILIVYLVISIIYIVINNMIKNKNKKKG